MSSHSFHGYIKGRMQTMSTSTKVVMLVFVLCFSRWVINYIFTSEGEGQDNVKLKLFLFFEIGMFVYCTIHHGFVVLPLDATTWSKDLSAEDLYVNSGREEFALDEAASSATFVLVIGYGRTGSSWLGEILSKADESFYVFEPMQRPMAEGYYLKNLVAFNDNTYRKPMGLLERHDYMMTTVHRIFTCQFSRLHPFSKEILVHHQVRMFNGTFKYCINFESYTSYYCIRELEDRCLSKTHRIVKTIRVPMELVSDMVEMWPNMKVINLFRDPRAITDSRLRGQDFKMAFNIIGHSMDMCTRMYEDIKYDWYIQRKHPGKLTIILYEAFAESPYAATGYVYDFLNMLFREKTWFWVYNSIRNHTTDTDYYATLRFNATEVARRWRKHLDIKRVQEIDYSCTEIYKALGYVPISSEEELRSDAVPSRRKIGTLEGYM